MGCASSRNCRRPTELYRVGEALPETSDMATEELLRRGIASAQEASCLQRCREARVRQVLLARRYLTAALQRYSRPGPTASPEISAHLLAVLLKLGEDAQSVQGILADCTGLFDAHVSEGVGGDTPHSRNSPSGSSVEVDTYGYDEMKENFLSPDSSDEEHELNSGEVQMDVSPSTNDRKAASEVDQASYANFSEFAFPKMVSEDSAVSQVARNGSEVLSGIHPSSPSVSPRSPERRGSHVATARLHVRDAVQDAAAAAALTVSSMGSPVMRLSSLQAKASRNREARRHTTSGSQASDSETGSRPRFAEIKEHGAWKSVIDEEGPHPETEELSSEVARRIQRTESQMSSQLEILGPGECFLSPPTPQRGTRTISGVFDTMSIAASCAPSMAPSVAQSPHVTMAISSGQDFGFPGNSLSMSPSNEECPCDKDTLLVRILSPVDGKEEWRFRCPLEADSEQQFLATLDRLCLHHVGQPLAGLNWLIRENEAFDRWQRRKCDVRMVEDLFDEWQQAAKAAKDSSKGGAVLHLCTIPVQPATELPPGKVRLKRLSPMRVTQSVAVQLETTVLEVGPVYSVAFTHQWSNMTYSVEAKVLPNKKGVEALCPPGMFSVSSNEGLYDVHLVIDSSSRSKNHQTLTVGSTESDLDSSAKSESTSSFVPIERKHSTCHSEIFRAEPLKNDATAPR